MNLAVISRRSLGILLGSMLLVAAPVQAAASDQQKLVDASTATFNSMMANKDMGWLRDNFGRAKAVIIAPSVVKAGFIFGGSGGHAVMLAKHNGKLTGPAFYTLGTASIGFQAGVSDSEIVTLVMTDKAVKSVLDGNFKVGGDASAAAGPVGGGAKSDVDADFITFSQAKGLYGGLNFEGTKIDEDKKWNAAFYGVKGVTPGDILVNGKVPNAVGAGALRAAVAKRGK